MFDLPERGHTSLTPMPPGFAQAFLNRRTTVNVLIAEIRNIRFAVLRNDPALEPGKAEATRQRWADFYPTVKFTVEVDTFVGVLPGYNIFSEAIQQWGVPHRG